MSNFRLIGANFLTCSNNVLLDFGGVVLVLVLVLVTRVKESQLLVLRLRLEFDNMTFFILYYSKVM